MCFTLFQECEAHIYYFENSYYYEISMELEVSNVYICGYLLYYRMSFCFGGKFGLYPDK